MLQLDGDQEFIKNLMTTDPLLKRVNEKIKEEQYYDAYTLAKSFLNRYMCKKRFQQAMNIGFYLCKEFTNKKVYDLASNFGTDLIQISIEYSYDPSDDVINMIIDLFESCENYFGKEKYQLIENAINWSTNKSSKKSPHTLKLRRIAGLACYKEKKYAQAVENLIYTASAKELVDFIINWSEQGYKSEKDLFLLRFILTLLTHKQIELATEIIHHPDLNIDFNDDELSPAKQLIFLIVEACKAKNIDFFKHIIIKYNLVLRRDPTLKELINQIEKNYFETKPSVNSNNVFSMLSNMMAF